jgi:hypothetical protein
MVPSFLFISLLGSKSCDFFSWNNLMKKYMLQSQHLSCVTVLLTKREMAGRDSITQACCVTDSMRVACHNVNTARKIGHRMY